MGLCFRYSMVWFGILISSILEVLAIIGEYLYMLIVFGFVLFGFRFLRGVSFVVEGEWCRVSIMFLCCMSKVYRFVWCLGTWFVIRVGVQLVRWVFRFFLWRGR